ncbi:unnamed protein product [Effrenium voratum]|uniref:Uncharacterized protein n=1 Tax=Effrenium voratum TaxID=2562239 RepID=A0AA36MX26_9DINO|nr:unnamed protein product [Effrenium voratum]
MCLPFRSGLGSNPQRHHELAGAIGRDSDSEGEVVVTARNRMGQLRRALQQMGSMSSVVSSIKTKPNPLLERRRSSCDFSNLLPIAMDESEELAEKEPGRSRALKMLLRMINLEVKTRQAHRRENLLRAVLDAFQCQVQVARHVRGTFTEQEAEAVHEAFERCTGPRVELGSENSLFWCLADLGLTGNSVNEKRRVWEQIALAFGNPMPEPQVEEEAASDKLQALMRKEGEGICEQDLILYVLPAVRRVLEEHCEEELSQKVQRLDSDIDVNRMPISLCARAARLLGVESNFFLQVAQETFEGSLPRMPATLSLELAGRALQRCRERVARRLRRKELQVKQELYLTEAKVMSSRPKLLELHLRFQAYCEPEKTEGLKVMSEESVKRLLKEMGKLPSSQGPDLGAFLQSDINIVGPRFTFARLWRLLEEQRKAALSWVQEEFIVLVYTILAALLASTGLAVGITKQRLARLDLLRPAQSHWVD